MSTEIIQVQPQDRIGVTFRSLERCPSCERLSPFEVNERGGQCDVKCVHCDWKKSGWFFEVLSAAMLTRRSRESPFEGELYGAFMALGLSASPRLDGSGITFCCHCEANRLDLSAEAVSCPSCGFSATGEPWEIATALKAAEAAHAAKQLAPLRPPLNVKRLYDTLDEQHPDGYPGAPGLQGIRIGFECPQCGPGKSHLSVEMFAVTCRACLWTASGEEGSESEVARSILAAWKGGTN